MKITLSMAISVNGIIATDNSQEDFLSHENWISWFATIKETDALIISRKTFETIKEWGGEYLADLQSLSTVMIVTHQDRYKVETGENFIIAHSPKEAINILIKKQYSSATLTAGSELNGEFVKQGLIDNIILNIEPVMVGKGIPLFQPTDFLVRLELIEMKPSLGKTIQLRYKVVK